MIKSRKIVFIALLAALSVLLGGIDNMIPTPIAPVKLGMGNIAVLLALYLIDTKSAIAVSVLKVILCQMLFGNASSFIYSAFGAVFSFALMLICKKTGKFSAVGVSAIGAVAHNTGQLLCAYFFIGKGALYYIPILASCGAVAGFLTGIVAQIIIKRGRGLLGKE